MEREILVSIIYAQYAILFLAWWLVMLYYGNTGLASWRAQNGTLRGLAYDALHPFLWSWRRVLCAFRIGDLDRCGQRPYSKYSPGTILRLAIAITSVAPALYFVRPLLGGTIVGSGLSMGWHILLLAFSILGGSMHLYIAFREQPGKWALYCVFSSLWFFLGPLLIYFLRGNSLS